MSSPRAAFREVPKALGPAFRASWLAIAASSLFLRSAFPIHAIGDAGLDDALFIRLARSLGAGEWLGPFNDTTLVKGMFYPLFILLSFLAGVPLKLAETGAYLATSACVARLALRGSATQAGRWGATLVFAALALNPVLWTVELARVVREGLYLTLSLAVTGLLVAALYRRGSTAAVAGRGLALGVVAGAYWITREEGIWLLPAALTAVVLRVGIALQRAGWRSVGPPCGALTLAVCGFGGVIGLNMEANRRVYGLAERLEVTSPAFEHAYGALSRIRHREWQRYVVLPSDAARLAFQVSSAARELQPFLEGGIGDAWRRASCDPPGASDCREILASWFQWALRDSVAAAGHYTSAADAAAFYARLALEIDNGCERGAIPCLPPRATLVPPFRWHYLPDTLNRAAELVLPFLRLGGDAVRTAPSTGPEEQIDAFEDTVGPVLRRPDPVTDWRGRLHLPSGQPALAIRSPSGAASRTDIALTPSPGAMAGDWEFLVSSTCPPDRCDLVLSSGGADLAAFPLHALGAGDRREGAGFSLQVDASNRHLARRGQTSRAAAILPVARAAGRVTAAVMPVIAGAGFMALLLVALLRRWDIVATPLFALVAASAVAALSRLALVSFLDVTAIPSVGILYLSPGTPFVILLGVGGLALLPALRHPAPNRDRVAEP